MTVIELGWDQARLQNWKSGNLEKRSNLTKWKEVAAYSKRCYLSTQESSGGFLKSKFHIPRHYPRGIKSDEGEIQTSVFLKKYFSSYCNIQPNLKIFVIELCYSLWPRDQQLCITWVLWNLRPYLRLNESESAF